MEKIIGAITKIFIGIMILGGIIAGLMLMTIIPLPFLENRYITSTLSTTESFEFAFEFFFRLIIFLLILVVGIISYSLGDKCLEFKRKKTD
ncbi:MAG: hypothetical protein AAB851_04100 [Patescibacteria group bacterium]